MVRKFKDEATGQSITEIVGLKTNNYSNQTLNTGAGIPSLNDPPNGEAGFRTKKRAKGIQRAAVARLRHEEFKAELDHRKRPMSPIVASVPSCISSKESRYGQEQYLSVHRLIAHSTVPQSSSIIDLTLHTLPLTLHRFYSAL